MNFIGCNRMWVVCVLTACMVVPCSSWGQCEGMHGDVDGDGAATNLDALIIQSHFLGLLDQFPIDTNGDGAWPEETCTPTPTDTPVPSELTITLPGGVEMDFVACPSGSFSMGSNDAWAYATEKPVHTVTFANGFYMGKYEVTQAQWEAVKNFNPSSFSSCGDACPVESVSWNDCQSFIDALNAHIVNTGQGPATVRLPSEAEWEYACRAGSTTRFSFGDSDCAKYECNSCNLEDYAWWCGNNDPEGTKSVGGSCPTPGAFTTCTVTCGSGARITGTTTTMAHRPTVVPGRIRRTTGSRGAVTGMPTHWSPIPRIASA